ncbi:hypothetical protein [Lacibacter sediminis]|uniref:Uncharacterized protein n=1 Tax=Lacibacter sediminis TaxID=2760713 RepID=A0A7G5XKK5_9BACT|nr:hypothetical protein [Lacibacter sediminis]QNA46008.1 hypothetical protein H4075_07435 [Lacibacter sediminis]
MQLRTFLFLVATVLSSTLLGQNLAGVWEGSFLLNASKKQKMSVRVELMETDGEYIGIVSSRGFDKNTAFGCDYLVGGRMYDGKISLTRKQVMRGVAMSKTDCAFFEELYLTVTKNNTATQLTGRWYWRGDAFDSFTAVKTDSVISEFTKDEIGDYIQELYKEFEERNILLKPENRLYQKVSELEVDGSDILLEFSSVDKGKPDSISVLFNGDLIANDHDLSKRPLRVRLKELSPGVNDIIVISQSIAQNKLKIRLLLKQGEITNEYMLEPGYIRNSLLLLKRKEN